MKHHWILTLLVCLLFGTRLSAQTAPSDAILGVWLTGSGKAHVKITKSGNYFYGRVVWLKEPLDENKKPKVDKNNPDVSARTNPIMGSKLLSGFEYTGDKTWEEGTIYDPENGKTYKCNIAMKTPTELNIRGFIGISLIGRTDIWKKVE